MPPVSESQRKLFWWAKNNPSAASKHGIKPSVAKDFTEADPGGKLPARVHEGKAVKAKPRRFGALG